VSNLRRIRRIVAAALDAAGAGPVVVGCSYGPDSLVLADAVAHARPGDATLVYVDHGLRPEAADEGAAVVAFAAAAGARAEVVRARVARAGTGLEDAARGARHAALERAADAAGARWILLGHTASDQAETVLGRLLRGAGPAGLAGIPRVRGRLVRPLLDVTRAEVLAYVAARGLTPAADPMNADRAFLRSRIRHDILPILRRENPNIDDILCRTARVMQEVSTALDWAADATGLDGRRALARELAALPAAIAKRLVGRAAPQLEARHLDAVLALARRPTAGSAELHLPGLVARREYDTIVIEEPRGAEPSCQVEITDSDPPDGPYQVRCFQPGDRMRPAALRGRSRKLQDLFTDRKVPARARHAAIVVVRVRDQEIVWAEHVGPAISARLQVSLTGRDPRVITEWS
jgi:tRNA(Ile)-lysidine synthase